MFPVCACTMCDCECECECECAVECAGEWCCFVVCGVVFLFCLSDSAIEQRQSFDTRSLAPI